MKISEIVAGMDPARYTTAQAARLVGRSTDTLKRWREDGVYVPSEHCNFGKVKVILYTDEDIVAMRKIADSLRPGPQPVA